MKNHMCKIIVPLILLSFIISFSVYAGTTGKIAGKVIDEETNEPLPGCNIIIEGTNLGAASNPDGEFFIINIPPVNIL